jgi:hypothetical protein
MEKKTALQRSDLEERPGQSLRHKSLVTLLFLDTMERLSRPASDYLKEIAWAIFMLKLIYSLIGLLLARHLGIVHTLWLVGLLIGGTTLFLGGIAVMNVLLVAVLDFLRRRRAPKT